MTVIELRQKRGKELKGLRTQKKITKVKLSQLTGMHRATITNMEKGKTNWTIDSELIYLGALKNL